MSARPWQARRGDGGVPDDHSGQRAQGGAPQLDTRVEPLNFQPSGSSALKTNVHKLLAGFVAVQLETRFKTSKRLVPARLDPRYYELISS
jgi:hypothetical protein